jgi:anaerobic dimethyl sulfoxide reductase subunit A
LPSLDEFLEKNLGAWSNPVTQPSIAFAEFREDPVHHPLATPSGKIEIFSSQLHDLHNPAEIPAVPKYIQEWESPFPGQMERNETISRAQDLPDPGGHISIPSMPRSGGAAYPLQAIGHHTLHRVHSTHANNDWLGEAFPQRVFINPLDAAPRDIRDGAPVRVWNDRGEIVLPARITSRILPGVIDIPQGAWWSPDQTGIDFGGCINVLTSERWTPFAFGTAQHTVMVEVEAYKQDSGMRPA